jgi:16S rRNA G966 N2-methylase RsmD
VAYNFQTLTILERHYKDGNEFLNHIVGVTGDETWESLVNVETKDQPKQWMHTNSPNKEITMAIQNKRRGMLTYGVVLLHDNARSHTAARTHTLLENFSWVFFDHPYSPALAPSDYRLFTHLKNWLRSQRFNNNEELMEGVKTWLRS